MTADKILRLPEWFSTHRMCLRLQYRGTQASIHFKATPLSYCFRLLFVLATVAFLSGKNQAKTWQIPVAGNSFRAAPEPGGRAIKRDRSMAWSDGKEVHCVFFHVDRAAKLELSMEAENENGPSTIETHLDDKVFSTVIKGASNVREIGVVETKNAGYVKVELKGIDRKGSDFGSIRSLIVESETQSLQLDFVRNNDGNMFYWGRRGPSVHLGYQVPKNIDLEYAYSEITVPVGEDTIGSYYMANGFGQGYFGFQVNSPTERRVLFSVWSPYKTDDPREIPEDQRIANLGRGKGVYIGKFGNEGSGGQSYLIYPWQAGKTYRFLTKVKPDGMGNTVYTSWFGDKSSNEWRLIASFRRPKTDTHLSGFHSFLESFHPTYGHIGRQAYFGNIWVRDVDGIWHECTKARFSVDATGGNRHRLDFTGGADGKRFYLRNCGFFSGGKKPGTIFERVSSRNESPNIDLRGLPNS